MGKVISDTSRLSYEKIMAPGAREGMYKKIILALEWIQDGTAWEIAKQANVKPDKCWKRLPELRGEDIIFDTGLRRNSPDGNPSMVYALSSRRSEYANVPKEVHYMDGLCSAADFACSIIAKSNNKKDEKETIITSKLEQRKLFTDD